MSAFASNDKPVLAAIAATFAGALGYAWAFDGMALAATVGTLVLALALGVALASRK